MSTEINIAETSESGSEIEDHPSEESGRSATTSNKRKKMELSASQGLESSSTATLNSPMPVNQVLNILPKPRKAKKPKQNFGFSTGPQQRIQMNTGIDIPSNEWSKQ